ncbi:MAG: DMT family transporter [Thermotogota bacterium]|nr:DMT family transporter [Thermotogota bacterium]
MQKSNEKLKANVLLFLVVLFWGMTFPLQKIILTDGVSPVFYNFIRFIIATAIIGIFGVKQIRKTTRNDLLKGLILGAFLASAYIFQTWGLVYTSSSKSAFITALYVTFVALLSPIIEKRMPTVMQIMAFSISLFGLYLLTTPNVSSFNFGDMLTLLCAIMFALHVVFISVFTENSVNNEVGLLFPQLFAVAIANLILVPFIPGKVTLNIPIVAVALFTALVASIFAVAVQLRYQKHLGSISASLIYVGEPAFALLFAVIILGENVGLMKGMGLGIMLIGVAFGSVSSALKFRRKNRREKNKIANTSDRR